MKITIKRLSILLLALVIAVLTVGVANAESIYYDSGLTYTYLSNEYVSIYGIEEGQTNVVIPGLINTRAVVDIRNSAFMNNTEISSLDLSGASYLQRIGSFAFSECSNLDGEINIPSSVTTVEVAAFQYCTSIDSLIYNATSYEVPNQCFKGCASLSSVTLNEGITRIGYFAFADCSNLNYLEIPASVSSISTTSFMNDDITLGVYRNSYALEYAENNGIKYVILDPEPTEPPTEPSTEAPTVAPTDAPTEPITPTDAPTEEPTAEPTQQPTQPVTEAPTEADVFILGDANGDNSVDVTDATVMQRYLANMHYIDEKVIMHGDVDGDGEISIQDVTFTLRYLASIEVPYPIDQPIKK